MSTPVPTTITPSAPDRSTLSPRIAYALVAAIIGLALFASGTPSPLYGTYRELWGFSPARPDARLRDLRVRRPRRADARGPDLRRGRPAAGAARSRSATLMGATVVFMLADSVVWLFVARGIQGLATGLALGAASAALLDLHPRRDPAGVGLTNGVVSAGGMGLGVLVSATLVAVAARAARPPLRRRCSSSSRSRSSARCGCPSRSTAARASG